MNGVSPVLGVRTDDKALQCTISGLDGATTYTVEVRGMDANAALSPPYVIDAVAGVATSPPNQPVPAAPATPVFKFDASKNLIALDYSLPSTVQLYYR